MKDQWTGNNINLQTLSQRIKKFFTDSQFETKLNQTKKGYTIEAATEKILNVQLNITVEITGQPNDFTIDFTAGKQRKGFLSPSMIIGYITTTLGGGSFLLSEVKVRESLEKLEKMFWEHVDKQITELTNSAEKQTPKQNNSKPTQHQ